jgi:hypothetical protein
MFCSHWLSYFNPEGRHVTGWIQKILSNFSYRTCSLQVWAHSYALIVEFCCELTLNRILETSYRICPSWPLDLIQFEQESEWEYMSIKVNLSFEETGWLHMLLKVQSRKSRCPGLTYIVMYLVTRHRVWIDSWIYWTFKTYNYKEL